MNDKIIETIKDWLPMVILLAIPVICVIAIAVIDGNHDDGGTPGWANGAADALEKNGGRIYIYREYGDSNYGYTTDVVIGKGNKIVADSTGLTLVYSNGGIAHFPYDRIANISINGATS